MALTLTWYKSDAVITFQLALVLFSRRYYIGLTITFCSCHQLQITHKKRKRKKGKLKAGHHLMGVLFLQYFKIGALMIVYFFLIVLIAFAPLQNDMKTIFINDLHDSG